MHSLALLLLMTASQAGEGAATRYLASYDPASAGALRVEISAAPDRAASVLVMPRAVPMGYADVDYARFVRDVRAFDAEGEALAVEREAEGPRWRLGSGEERAATVAYVVDFAHMERETLSAADSSKARAEYVGLLGYSVFAYLEGSESRPVELTVRAPAEWPVFLTLAPTAPPATGEAGARAADFYALADSQVALGPALAVRRFDAAVPLFVAQYAEAESDLDAFGSQAARALNALVELFGTRPFPHYTVHVEFLEPLSARHSYGFSMEHLESCTIYFDTERVLSKDGDAEVHLYNLAHHMAHAWIPKRCAAAGYFPWTWELTPVLDSIWFSEGWGQYAAAMALAKEGGLGDAFRHRLVETRFRQPLASMPEFLNRMDLVEVSRIASTRYGEDFRTGRSVFARGGLMAYEIDEAIRAATEGEKDLRVVLRRMMREGVNGPLELARIPQWCEEETGVDVADLHRRWMGALESHTSSARGQPRAADLTTPSDEGRDGAKGSRPARLRARRLLPSVPCYDRRSWRETACRTKRRERSPSFMLGPLRSSWT